MLTQPISPQIHLLFFHPQHGTDPDFQYHLGGSAKLKADLQSY